MRLFKNITLSNKNSKYTDPILAFIITFLSLAVFCFMSDLAPFGNGSILKADLITQYAPYIISVNEHIDYIFSDEADHLISNLSYSDNIGAGKNYFATFGYYSASPINLLAHGIDSTSIASFVLISIIIKLSFSSMFMTIFLKKRQTVKTSHFPIMLGVAYSFSMYSVVYLFNIIWLDAYALLPLVLYYIERYLDIRFMLMANTEVKHRCFSTGLIITLIILFVSHFYTAYMVGVFSFLYLIMRIVEKTKVENCLHSFKEVILSVVYFICNAIVSALLSSIVLIPVAYDLLSNGNSYSGALVDRTQYEKDVFGLYVHEMMELFFIGRQGNGHFENNNPFIFVGLFITLSIAVFFVSKKFDKKDKIIYGAAFLVMLMSFAVKELDIAWHAFDNPNWFEHRYAFCFLPIFLIVTQKVYEALLRRQVSTREIAVSLTVLLCMLFFVQWFGSMQEKDETFLCNLFFLVAYALLMIGIQKEKWHEQLRNMQKISFVLIVILMLSELLFVKSMLTVGYCGLERITDGRLGKIDIAAYEALIEEASETSDAPKIEVEKEAAYILPPNIANYMNYNSISVFNTSANKAFERLLVNLGFFANPNFFYVDYSYSSMPIDSFFGLGSILSTSEYSDAELVAFVDLDYNRFNENANSSEDVFVSYGNVTEEAEMNRLYLYHNPYALQLAFPVSSRSFSFDIHSIETDYADKNYFDMQNEWFSSLFEGYFVNEIYYLYNSEYVGEPVITNAITYPEYIYSSNYGSFIAYENDYYNADITEGQANENVIYSQNPSMPMLIEYEFVAQQTGEHYINISATTVLNQTEVYVGETKIAEFADSSNMSAIVRIGYFEEGDTINVSISSDNEFQYRYLAINFACLDHEYFASEMEQVLANAATGVTMTDYEQGYVTFNTNLGEGEMLLTTIPYEAGWTCYVDGVETEITPYQGALIAVDVGSGSHEVVLEFVAPGLVLGFIVSAAALGVLVVAGFVQIILKSRSKSIQNK